MHGVSAAWWHGLVESLPATVQITLPRARRGGTRPGVQVRRRDLAVADRVPLRLLQVTDLPLTVLEAAVSLGREGAALLDRALQRSVRFPAVYRAHCRNLGRRGSAAASALLSAAADRAAWQAERRLVRLLREAGIAGWRLGYRWGPFLIDLAFPAERVAIEVDGWAWHVDAARFTADRRRQNALVTAGWTVLRFTWHDLDRRGAGVVADVRAALRLSS